MGYRGAATKTHGPDAKASTAAVIDFERVKAATGKALPSGTRARMTRKQQADAKLDLALRAWKLKLSGLTAPEIAKEIEVTVYKVHELLNHYRQIVIASNLESAQTERDQALAKLDQTIQRAEERLSQPASLPFASSLLSVIEKCVNQKAKILGLHQQLPTELTITNQASPKDAAAIVAELFGTSKKETSGSENISETTDLSGK